MDAPTVATVILVAITGWYAWETHALVRETRRQSAQSQRERLQRGRGQIILLWNELTALQGDCHTLAEDPASGKWFRSWLSTSVWKEVRCELATALPTRVLHHLTMLYERVEAYVPEVPVLGDIAATDEALVKDVQRGWSVLEVEVEKAVKLLNPYFKDAVMATGIDDSGRSTKLG